MKKILIRLSVVLVVITVICVALFTACKDNTTDPYGTNSSQNTTTTAPTTQSTVPSVSISDTTVPPVSDTTQLPTVTTTAPTTTAAPTTAEPTTLSKEEVMQNNIIAMCGAVNVAKATPNFYGHKDQKVSFEITECSVSTVISIANKIISNFAHDNVKEYTFTNGVSPNPKSGEDPVTPNEALPPTNLDLRLDPAGLVSLDVTTDGTNTIYTAVIAEEKVTLDNQVPYYHAMALDYLDLNGTDIPGAKIKSATITYQDATITVAIDNTTGKLSSYRQITPIICVGDVSVMGIPANGTVVGKLDETWTFNW